MILIIVKETVLLSMIYGLLQRIAGHNVCFEHVVDAPDYFRNLLRRVEVCKERVMQLPPQASLC